jgi:cellobiose transport system substrate-binding protein
MPMSVAPLRLVTTVIAVAAALGALAGCSGSKLGFHAKASGPPVTLHVAVYGSPGYSQAGLYTNYEALHPGAHIVEQDLGQEQAYWQKLRGQLSSGTTGADLIAIPADDIATAVRRFAGKLVPLNTLGGTAAGVNTFTDNWAPWLSQPAQRHGTYYAIAAETGPLAVCYRPILLREASMPSTPSQLSRAWSTWQGYLSYARTFHQRISHGPAFMDSVASMYNAMVSQSQTQYYSAAGTLAAAGNPSVKSAWSAATKAAKEGLSAKLTPLTTAWDTGVQRLQFATAICAPWMLGRIQQDSGRTAPGTWAITKVPGGTGNWGGFYLAIPRTSQHQQDAYQLAQYLTSQQSGPAVARAGGFPASSPAINAAASVTNAYFSTSPTGSIFGTAADRVPAAPTGPAQTTISAAFDRALTTVEAGKSSPSAAWAKALTQAKRAYKAAKRG